MKTWLSRRPFVVDTFIALLLLSLGVLEVRVNRMALPHFGEGPLLADVAWSAVTCLPLVWRRVFPLTVMVAVVVFAVSGKFAGVYSGSGASVAMFLAVYSAGAYSHHKRRDNIRGGLVAAVMALLVAGTFFPALGRSDSPFEAEAFLVLLNTAFFAAAWILGDITRQKHVAQTRLEKQAEVLESQREELTESAVASERLRIARELHDVVGHHVSVMGVQAGAARRLLEHDPDRAREVLSGVEASGRDAVTEMGSLVGLLRSSGDEVPGPQPGFSDLDAMIERMGDAGLDVKVSRIGRPGRIGAAAELSLYRIIQESLTNALRHAEPPEAKVRLAGLVDRYEVEVTSPRGVDTATNGSGGRGVIGMRERVLLHGGEFDAGPYGDVYRVLARIPYRETS